MSEEETTERQGNPWLSLNTRGWGATFGIPFIYMRAFAHHHSKLKKSSDSDISAAGELWCGLASRSFCHSLCMDLWRLPWEMNSRWVFICMWSVCLGEMFAATAETTQPATIQPITTPSKTEPYLYATFLWQAGRAIGAFYCLFGLIAWTCEFHATTSSWCSFLSNAFHDEFRNLFHVLKYFIKARQCTANLIRMCMQLHMCSVSEPRTWPTQSSSRHTKMVSFIHSKNMRNDKMHACIMLHWMYYGVTVE